MSEVIISSNAMTDLHNDFFKKSHELVFSQLALSPIEHDMFALFLTKLHKEHWDEYINNEAITKIPSYEFSSDLLSDWFGIEKKHLYASLYKPAQRLASKSIGINDPKAKKFKFLNLFASIEYVDGTLKIDPTHKLLDEYLCLSKGHSQIPHKQFRAIELEHAKRLFTMLCRFKHEAGTLHPQPITELHSFFGLKDEKGNLQKKTYANTSVFIRRIIKPAIQEIEKVVPDITFDIDEKTGNRGFAYIKEGRSIVAIKFLFSWDSPAPKPKKSDSIVITEEMSKAEFTYSQVLNLVPGEAGNPTSDELANMMANASYLVQRGLFLDKQFMANYMIALAEAK